MNMNVEQLLRTIIDMHRRVLYVTNPPTSPAISSDGDTSMYFVRRDLADRI